MIWLKPAIGLLGVGALTLLGFTTSNRPVNPQRANPPQDAKIAVQAAPKVDLVGHGEAARVVAQAATVYETELSVIANNLANAETVAFKRSHVVLESGSYRHETVPGSLDTAGQYTPVGISVGTGVQVAGVRTDFRQGPLMQTGRDLDLAIDGRGFFQVTDPATGEILYTRAGNFCKNPNGDLVIGSAKTGRLIEPAISIPEDAMAVVVSPEGIVSVRQPGTSSLCEIGQIQLANFINPEGLLKQGENLYRETDASGAPVQGNPGQPAFGRLQQGALEGSNVRLQRELARWTETTGKLQAMRTLTAR